MSVQDLDLSVIIPCYNEEDILVKNVGKISEVLDKSTLRYEIILVDDCSKDRTVELAKEIVKNDSKIKMICHKVNMGRGKAVEDGIAKSRGRVAGFLDIDLQVPAHYIIPLFIELENGADVATALRVYDIRLHMLHRFILSKGYNTLFNLMLRTPIKDSETGYKFFKRDKVLSVIPEIKDKHWFWDTEVMVRSFLKGLVIKEVPCLCIREEEQKSTVKVFKDVLDYFRNIWRFKKEVDCIREAKRVSDS